MKKDKLVLVEINRLKLETSHLCYCVLILPLLISHRAVLVSSKSYASSTTSASLSISNDRNIKTTQLNVSNYGININNNNNNNNNNNSIMTEETPSITGIALKLARSNILELQPYRCARDDYSEGVLLDANENAFGPTSVPSNSLDPYDNSNSLERYPDPYQKQLKELFCRERGHDLQPSNIFVGVGSDEAIDLLMRIFCTPGGCAANGGDNILITPPTYGMYKVCAKVNDVQIISVPLTPDFDLNVPNVRNILHYIRTFLSSL
jgi:hypothetical protein